jgi:hypothetical protein
VSIPASVWATAGLVGAAVMMIVGASLVATSQPASADIITDGGVLSLDAEPGVLSDASMAPGDSIYWPISAQLDASTSGQLTLKVVSSQALATSTDGLELALASCPIAWTIPADPSVAPTCEGGAGHSLIPETPFAGILASKTWNLGRMSAISDMPMMATISLPQNTPAQLQGTSADVNFGFTALGDTESADPSKPPLATTGIDPTGPALLGLGLLLAGLTIGRLRIVSRRRLLEVEG